MHHRERIRRIEQRLGPGSTNSVEWALEVIAADLIYDAWWAYNLHGTEPDPRVVGLCNVTAAEIKTMQNPGYPGLYNLHRADRIAGKPDPHCRGESCPCMTEPSNPGVFNEPYTRDQLQQFQARNKATNFLVAEKI